MKEKIDKGNSLIVAKEVLNFQCTEEEAYSVYLKLRSLKKTFLQLPRNDNVSLPSQNVVLALQGVRKRPPSVGHPSTVSSGIQNVKIAAEKESSSLETSEKQTSNELNGNYVDRKIKMLQKKCDKHIFQLQQKNEKEILEFHKIKEQEKLKLEEDHQLESALIRTTYPENATRMDMLKSLYTEFKKKMQEHENSMEVKLQELQARHSAEMKQKKKMLDDWMNQMMSCIPSSRPEKEVSSANPDNGKQNSDGLVHDYVDGNVITSGISVTIADNVVEGVVCSEASLSTPVNVIANEELEIEQVGAEPITVAEQPEEPSQRLHQFATTIAQEAISSVVCSESTLVSPVPDEDLDIEQAGAEPITVIEQSEETNERPPQIPKTLAQEAVGNVGSETLCTPVNPVPAKVLEIGGASAEPITVIEQSEETNERPQILEILSKVSVGYVGCSETLCPPVNPVPSKVLEIGEACAKPVSVIEQLEETSQRSPKIPDTTAQEAVGCSLNAENSPPLLNSTSQTVSDTAIETLLVARAEQDITADISFHGMDDRAPIDLATSKEQNSDKISSSSIGNEPSGVPGMAGSQIGKASTSEMDTRLEVQVDDGAGNSMGSDAMGNRDVLAADTISLPTSGLPHKHVCDNTGKLAPECKQLAAEACHGQIEGRTSSLTPATSVQIGEGSVELPHQAVSQNGNTAGLPPFVEGMDAGHLSSGIEGSNAIPTSAASLQIVDGSVENSHQEMVVLPPSSEVAGPNHCYNHFDLEIVSGAEDGPNVELPAASQNILAPIQQAENIIRSPNHASMQSEPNLAMAEGPTHLPVLQMHRTGHRNPTLPSHAEPLQIELEMMRKDTEQIAKIFDSAKLQLKSLCEKEIEEAVAQIRRKYEAKIKEAESEFLSKKTQLDLNYKKVYMNKILADAFQSKCVDGRNSGNSTMKQAAPPSFIQHMHHLSLQPRLRHLSAAAALSSGGQPASSQQNNVLPVQSHHRSSVPFASVPARPPQISAITPSIGNLRGGGEIRAPAPHLQPFRSSACSSAAAMSSSACNISSPQLPANLPAASVSPLSVPAHQPLPSLASQFLVKPHLPSQSPSLLPQSRINQEVSSNQPPETQNGVQPVRRLNLSAMELLLDMDDQAGGHLPNILQNLAGSASNTHALDPSVSKESGNTNKGIANSDAASDVVCLSDDDN